MKIKTGYGADALDIKQLINQNEGNRILNGCTPSKGTNALEIDIASGEAYFSGTTKTVSSTTVTLSSGNSDPRKDVIYIDNTGTVQVSEGTPETAYPEKDTRFYTYNPEPNDLSETTAIVVAEIWIPANASDITTDDIRDRRILSDYFYSEDAVTAINNDGDHGSTASHNYFSESHQDLTNLNSDDHHTKYTDENAQDAVGTIMSGSGSTTVDYDDSNNTITVSSSDKTDEEIQDLMNDTISGSNAIKTNYDDPNNTLTIEVTESDISHDNISNVSANDHINNITDIPNRAHNDLNSISTDDHHTKTGNDEVYGLIRYQSSAPTTSDEVVYVDSDENALKVYDTGSTNWITVGGYTDSDAIDAINTDSDHGSTASHNYFSGSHQDLTNLNTDDHHTKYTDENAQDAVNALLIGGNKVSLTYDDTNNDLTIDSSWRSIESTPSSGSTATSISSDWANTHIGTSDAHHTKYTDSDAETAINNDSDHGSTASHNYYTDSDAETAINNDGDHGSTASHNYFSGSHQDLTNLNTDDHHTKYTNEEAQDAVGTIMTSSGSASVNYDDANNVITIGATDTDTWRDIESVPTSGNTGTSISSDWANSHIGSSSPHHSKTTSSDIDHGSVSGLGDDDHTQYFLADGTRSMSGDISDDQGNTIWDYSAQYVPESALQNNSVTVAGNSVSLGGSTTVNHGDLSNISSNDHHAQTTSSDIDHGSVGGLGNDDHTQYLLADGTRSMSGSLDMSGNSIVNVGDLNVSSVDSNNGDAPIAFHQGITVDGDVGGDGSVVVESGLLETYGALKVSDSSGTNKFDVQYNSGTESLDFNYVG